jgi:hypothetical protein
MGKRYHYIEKEYGLIRTSYTPYYKLCRVCLGKGKVDWIQNIIKKESKNVLNTDAAILNLTNTAIDILDNIIEPEEYFIYSHYQMITQYKDNLYGKVKKRIIRIYEFLNEETFMIEYKEVKKENDERNKYFMSYM